MAAGCNGGSALGIVSLKSRMISSTDAPGIHAEALTRLLSGEISCLVVRGFIEDQIAALICERLMDLPDFLPHKDVPGLQVLGYSHFQAVRDPELFCSYSRIGKTLQRRLEEISSPEMSPFQTLLDYLCANTNRVVEKLSLEQESELAPFTVRACHYDVGIEPHQDLLAAESPAEKIPRKFTRQLAVNLFLSAADDGGDLEIFDLGPDDTGYDNLDDGPKSVEPESLPEPCVSVRPKTGDLILFDSTLVHRVLENSGAKPRMTLSCFAATSTESSKLRYWV